VQSRFAAPIPNQPGMSRIHYSIVLHFHRGPPALSTGLPRRARFSLHGGMP
jgi:hypothetical protein